MPETEDYFLGEDHRCCYQTLHILWGLRLVLVIDIIQTLSFQLVVPLVFGYFDGFCIVQLCISLTVISCVVVDLWKEGRNLAWPYIFYRCFDAVACSLLLLLFVGFITCGKNSRKLLFSILRWRFRLVTGANEEQYLGVSLLVLAFQMVFGYIAFYIAYSAQKFFREKALRKYMDQRREGIKYLHGAL